MSRQSSSLRGGCLCGTVRWACSAEPTPLAHCHCSVCRKMHGAAFATWMAVPGETVSIESGAGSVQVYESSPGFRRRFCAICGSVVPGIAADGHGFLPAGALDADPGTRPKIHIFVSARALWYRIEDTLRRFDTFPKGPGPACLADHGTQTEGALAAGSCNCGAVVHELTAPVTRAHHCHCSRCRRARAAAHTTNAFAPLDSLRFVRGESDVAIYHLPEAAHFAQAFCRHCGAKVPRADAGRGWTSIPLGGLDVVPPVRPSAHIHCDSKAPWLDIAGRLPRYAKAAT